TSPTSWDWTEVACKNMRNFTTSSALAMLLAQKPITPTAIIVRTLRRFMILPSPVLITIGPALAGGLLLLDICSVRPPWARAAVETTRTSAHPTGGSRLKATPNSVWLKGPQTANGHLA